MQRIIEELRALPDAIRKTLECHDRVKEVAEKYADARNALYLGRQYLYPAALEGALKLKEISYIHAEGYPAAEMKHGPIALVDEQHAERLPGAARECLRQGDVRTCRRSRLAAGR